MAYKNKADQAAAARKHYLSNTVVMKARAVAHKTKHRARLRELIVEQKSKPCADCGESYPPYVMDFDHIADDKDGDVASMVNRALSEERVLAEIAKCEVVCANCHRERTHQRAYSKSAA